MYIFFLRREIILWIELPWLENAVNTYARHTETLDRGYNNYAVAYFQSSWEVVALEVTVSSVKSTDVTYKTLLG